MLNVQVICGQFLSRIPEKGQSLVGGKAFNLARLANTLKLPVPGGFVITTNAFHRFIEHNQLHPLIKKKLAKVDITSLTSLESAASDIAKSIRQAVLPDDLSSEICSLADTLLWDGDQNRRVAVRSSALGEDTDLSFAGQYRTILNVSREEICDAYKEILISKYSARSLYYRIYYGLSDFETAMAVLVLLMVPARLSGVVYSRDPELASSDSVLIHSSYGLGSILVEGRTSPDQLILAKTPAVHVLARKKGGQAGKLVAGAKKGLTSIPLSDSERCGFSLDDASAMLLAEWAITLEQFFGSAQDIEWCINQDGKVMILQSRPLKTVSEETSPLFCDAKPISGNILFSGGEKASSGISSGEVFKLQQDADLQLVPTGAMLVTQAAHPHYVPILHRVAGVICDLGSKAGHFASVAREFRVPLLVNTKKATEILKNGDQVTLHADRHTVYEGLHDQDRNARTARSKNLTGNPFNKKMRFIISSISPLRLTEPESDTFRPEGCRSLHDIIRYSHEMALKEMFAIGDKRPGRSKSAKMLSTDIPITFYILDIGRGLTEQALKKQQVALSDVRSLPLVYLFEGLNHPGIHWSKITHFNWEEFDSIALAGGMVSKNSVDLASYAMVSDDYLNLNLRFGYHFVIIDCLFTADPGKNHLMFRFTGGGGIPSGKVLRSYFLNAVLQKLGFKVETKGELVDAQLKGAEKEPLKSTLNMLGRLLGATRLMDMVLKNTSMADTAVEEFFKGRYHFGPAGSNKVTNG